MSELVVDVDGVRIVSTIHGDLSGSAVPVVVLHGFLGSAEAMRTMVDELGRRPAVAVDLVGHGRSDAPDEAAAYRVDAMARQVAAVAGSVADHPVDVVGYSMGGRVALTLAVATPEIVRRLVVIGADPGIDVLADRVARAAADDQLAASLERDGIEAFVDRWEAQPIFASQHDLPDATRAAIRSIRTAQRPAPMAAVLRHASTGRMTPLWDALGDMVTPTTMVVGAADQKYRAIGRRFVAAVPSAELVVVDDAGHAVHVERPSEVAALIDAFLAR